MSDEVDADELLMETVRRLLTDKLGDGWEVELNVGTDTLNVCPPGYRNLVIWGYVIVYTDKLMVITPGDTTYFSLCDNAVFHRVTGLLREAARYGKKEE